MMFAMKCVFALSLCLVPILASAEFSQIVLNRPETQCKSFIVITTPSFQANGLIPLKFSKYGKNVAPTIRWKSLPPKTQSVVMLCEDPDAPTEQPFAHWVRHSNDLGKHWIEGTHNLGQPGWFGPRPPMGRTHHYHFQVFALDCKLSSKPMNRDEMVLAMTGHVLAKGQVVGLFSKPQG
jgi:Raf kinase inhibitor-like YbhB/YbcL family protein